MLTRAQVLFLPQSLSFKVEVSYAPRALNKDILKAKLTNMLQTIPNNKKTCLVKRLKMSVGLAFKLPIESKCCSVNHLIG